MIMFSTYLLGMSSCVDHYLLHKKASRLGLREELLCGYKDKTLKNNV